MRATQQKQEGRRFAIGACIVAVLFATACGQQVPPDTRDRDQSTIRELDAQWAKTAGARDLDGTVSYYSDDASMLSPNAPIASDRKSIRAAWADLLVPELSVTWQVTKLDVARSGDLAYLLGTYQITPTEPQSKLSADRGKLVEVWKKQPDGQWKTVADIFNSDLPLTPSLADKKK